MLNKMEKQRTKTPKELLKESGLQQSGFVSGAYDYREVYYKFPAFPSWRNQKLGNEDYGFKQEIIDKHGDLLISSKELEMYLNENSQTLSQIAILKT